MKNLSNTRKNNFRYLTAAIMLGFIIMLFSGTALAQNGKNKKADKMGQGTLKEAKVTARVITSVEEISPMRVKLNVLNPTGKTVRISILNFGNEAVFKDSFTGKEYNKVLNFTQTAAGRYKLQVTGPKQTDVRRFAINSDQNRSLQQSELAREKTTDVIASIHKTEPTKIMLHLVNNTGEKVNYVFRNEAKDIIHSGVIKTAQFSKVFDMSSVTDGKYTLEVDYKADKVAARSFDMQTVYNRSFAWTDKRGRPLSPPVHSPITQRASN